MKRKLKSAFIITLVPAACLILAACDSVQWPHVYGPDEVPQNVRDEPRLVPSAPPPPASSNINPPNYPRLGDVPMRPRDFMPAAAIEQTKTQMENDRAEAQMLRQKAEPPVVVSPPTASP